MGEITIPFNLTQLTGTLVGLAIWSFFVGQWAKNALGDWRWTNWITLLIVTVTALGGTIILNSWDPTAEQVMWSIILGVMATSFETFGYEAISNGLGKVLGWGTRSDEALLERAVTLVAKKQFDLE